MAKGAREQKVSSKVNLTKLQKQLTGSTKPYVDKYIKKTSPGGVKLPKTPLVAPVNENQTAGQTAALGAIPAQQKLADAGAAASTDLLSGNPSGSSGVVEQWQDPNAGATDFLLNKVLFPETNPALQSAINAATRPITDQLLEEALPAVRSGAYTGGAYGGSRQGIAEGLSTGRAARAVGDTAANVANQGYQAGLGAMSSAYGDQLAASTSAYGTRQDALSSLYSNNLNARLNALGLLPETQQAQLQPGLTQSGVGDVQKAQEQERINEEVYRKLFKQMSPMMSAQALLGLAGAAPGGGSTSTAQMPATNPLSGMLGGASLGAALIPGLGPLGALGGAAAGGALSLA